MATSSMVPYSNPAGNNQTSPSAIVPTSGAGARSNPGGILPVVSPVASPVDTAAQNPLIPASALTSTGASAPTGASGAVPTTGNPTQTSSFITQNSSYASGENDLQKQLIDIYGKGVGGSLFSILSNMSGTNSTILQQYVASLQPQFAQAQAGLDSSLGAGGVSPNSSVAALGEANLKSQENALVAGESANLTQNQEQMTLDALMGQAGAASKEVASSGWDVFGNVMGDLGKLGASVVGGAGAAGGFSNLFS